jgi:hypothetical protein
MNPKLRDLDIRPIEHEGRVLLLLRDSLALADSQIGVPRELAPLLALMDGTRDESALEAALLIRAGVKLAPGLLAQLLADLDEVFLLENDRFANALTRARQAFRDLPCRPMTTLDGASLSAQPEKARAWLQSYVDGLPGAEEREDRALIRGLVCPHIDYHRGGPVYAEVWRAVADAARQAERVIILGTDHQGSDCALTLTRQSYCTPWGVLPTDQEVVAALADALGEEAVFGEELHHRGEHSIELAAAWLHFFREGQPVPMAPILCGHFQGLLEGSLDPAEYEPFSAAVDALRPAMESRRTLVVAAAALAHMGPAFGDAYGLDAITKAQLRGADERLLEAICAGDAADFFGQLREVGNRRHVCGLPPIYLTLRLLGETWGEPAGYDQCPADAEGLSFVSIAGAVLY